MMTIAFPSHGGRIKQLGKIIPISLKKCIHIILTFIFFANISWCFASEPLNNSLTGIWENSHCYLVFDDGTDDDQMSAVFKLFYQWYYDPVLAPKVKSSDKENEYSLLPVYRNAASSQNCPNISSSINSFGNNVYSLLLGYKQKTLEVPVVIINSELYTDFCMKGSAHTKKSEDPAADTEIKDSEPADGNTSKTITGYWRPFSNISEITLYQPTAEQEIYGWYFTDDASYKIRYWQTDAPYTEIDAVLNDGENSYSFDKYIKIGEITYTCVHGLKTDVRNIQKVERPEILLNEDKTAFAVGKPFLTKLCDAKSEELYAYLSDLITVQNKKTKPARKPDIEYLDLDFHYDEIEKIQNKK